MLTFKVVDELHSKGFAMEFSKDFFDNTDKAYAKYRDAIDTLAINAISSFLGVTEYEATALMGGESLPEQGLKAIHE